MHNSAQGETASLLNTEYEIRSCWHTEQMGSLLLILTAGLLGNSFPSALQTHPMGMCRKAKPTLTSSRLVTACDRLWPCPDTASFHLLVWHHLEVEISTFPSTAALEVKPGLSLSKFPKWQQLSKIPLLSRHRGLMTPGALCVTTGHSYCKGPSSLL